MDPVMTSRRQFLGAATSALALVPVAGPAFAHASGAAGSRPSFYKVVYDERLTDCLAFAAEAAALGAATHGIRGDVTSLWYDDLYYRWREDNPAAIAGLTLEPAAFCLKVFARDAGLHQLLRGDHVCTAHGHFDHTVSAPMPIVRRVESLSASGEGWGAGVARLLSGFDGRMAPRSRASARTGVMSRGDTGLHLVSWVIAPGERRLRSGTVV
ncbi:MAG: hypothetical protein EPO25_17830 [Gammaproteobacteria bacterium]|nr:MAG: hypothetical protein EPO25_17830 [Gammaproteobacteria bacterium]